MRPLRDRDDRCHHVLDALLVGEQPVVATRHGNGHRVAERLAQAPKRLFGDSTRDFFHRESMPDPGFPVSYFAIGE
jgi:hypothetical protein